MRLFIGIPIAREAAQKVVTYTERLRKAGDDLRWSTPESWHITLQFLGNTTPEQYKCVTAGLRTIRAPQFEVHLADTGFFGRAGIFHIDVPPTTALSGLQQKVVATTLPCGFDPEDRDYHPHITLARSRARGQALAALKQRLGPAPRFSSFTAREFLLYESHLNPRGARYEIRERFSLGLDLQR